MKNVVNFIFVVCIVSLLSACQSNKDRYLKSADSSLVNTKHLDNLYTPVIFEDSVKAAGIFIYSEAPDYHLVADSDEGFTCVDDISRATLVYLRSKDFFTDTNYIKKAIEEVNNFYPWLLKNGMMSSFSIVKKEDGFSSLDEKEFPQIAYGFRPMIFAAAEAYEITEQEKYADIAGHLAAWFLGANTANEIMYDKNTGRCFDGIISKDKVNKNSGAESTIECLLALQKIEKYPAIITALNKYKKQ